MKENTIIGRVLITAKARWRGYNIYSVPDYGITCGIGTTNGNIRVAAELLKSLIANAALVVNDVPDYTAQVFIRERPVTVDDDIFSLLLENYNP